MPQPGTQTTQPGTQTTPYSSWIDARRKLRREQRKAKLKRAHTRLQTQQQFITERVKSLEKLIGSLDGDGAGAGGAGAASPGRPTNPDYEESESPRRSD